MFLSSNRLKKWIYDNTDSGRITENGLNTLANATELLIKDLGKECFLLNNKEGELNYITTPIIKKCINKSGSKFYFLKEIIKDNTTTYLEKNDITIRVIRKTMKVSQIKNKDKKIKKIKATKKKKNMNMINMFKQPFNQDEIESNVDTKTTERSKNRFIIQQDETYDDIQEESDTEM